MRRRGRPAALALGVALAVGGCVASEHAEVVAARGAWGCHPAHEECPTPR